MYKQIVFYSLRLRIISGAVLIALCLPLLSFLPAITVATYRDGSLTAKSEPSESSIANSYDSPNVVSAGVLAGTAELGQTPRSTADKLGHSVTLAAQLAYNGLRTTGKVSTAVMVSVIKTTGSVLAFAAHGLIDSMLFAGRVAGSAIGLVTKTPVVSAYIRPADASSVAVIDPNHVPLTEKDGLVSDADVSHKNEDKNTASKRPIDGQITTQFGVPHWPFQETHTGMDISSGRPLGTTPVLSFRAGTVTERVYSDYGLGNYVVVDHGRGLTSVYAHLSSVLVEVGQHVDAGTVLGKEGSTGASTGSHLHFEIRHNGEALDPSQYVDFRR